MCDFAGRPSYLSWIRRFNLSLPTPTCLIGVQDMKRVELEVVNPAGPGAVSPPPVLDPIDVSALGKQTYEEKKKALEWHARILKWTNIGVMILSMVLCGIPAYFAFSETGLGSLFSIFLVLSVSAAVNVVGVLLSMCGQRRVCHE